MNLMSRELAVIQILWDAEEPITVVGIVVREENETIDSVQWGTKNLLKKNLIAIEDYTQMENKIAHRLKPLVKQESIEGVSKRSSKGNSRKRTAFLWSDGAA